ncbi:MAG TPA: RDD family protein, partial [Candidatus Dormibacteraeota bacterium]
RVRERSGRWRRSGAAPSAASIMNGVWNARPVHQEHTVRAPLRPAPARLRDAYFAGVRRLTFGLIRGERWRLRLGPLTMLAFGEPTFDGTAWTWPITGGVLARRPGGVLRYGWRGGELVAVVDGYLPRLPAPLYGTVQILAHRLVTRRFLLDLRGRLPPAGPAAGPAGRMLAASLDLALCAGVTAALRPRRRLLSFVAMAATYHVACWTLTGRTAGGLLTGQRVVSVDGSPVAPWQALLRLAALPLAARSLRPAHDETAATEVVVEA